MIQNFSAGVQCKNVTKSRFNTRASAKGKALKTEINMSCNCGRSPIGKCVGWHKLDEDQYLERKAAWEAKQAAKKDAA